MNGVSVGEGFSGDCPTLDWRFWLSPQASLSRSPSATEAVAWGKHSGRRRREADRERAAVVIHPEL
jgi:hypothetical protein